jgi:integrase
MAHIRKRTSKAGKTTYQVRYWLDGRETSSTLATYQEARKFGALIDVVGPEQALREAFPDQYAEAADGDSETVGHAVAVYLDALAAGLPSPRSRDGRPANADTIGDYRRHLRTSIIPKPLGTIRLTELDETDIAVWMKELAADGNSEKTIYNKRSPLLGALDYAVKQGKISINPAAAVKPERTFNEAADMREEQICLTHAEFEEVLAAMPEHYHPFLRFLVETGCRFNEATALRPRDINRRTNTVSITKTFRRGQASGKGHHIGTPKTVNAKRKIAVRESLLDSIEFHDNDDYVFRNTDSGPIRINTFRTNVWTKRMAKSGLPLERRPRLHDLRHTSVSWLIEAGWNPIKVSRRVGHANPTITMNTYTHLFHRDDDTIQAELDKAFSG